MIRMPPHRSHDSKSKFLEEKFLLNTQSLGTDWTSNMAGSRMADAAGMKVANSAREKKKIGTHFEL